MLIKFRAVLVLECDGDTQYGCPDKATLDVPGTVTLKGDYSESAYKVPTGWTVAPRLSSLGYRTERTLCAGCTSLAEIRVKEENKRHEAERTRMARKREGKATLDD